MMSVARLTRKWSSLKSSAAAAGKRLVPPRAYASHAKYTTCFTALVGLGAATYAGSAATTSSCERKTKTQNDAPILGQILTGHDKKNPLWPGGCREEDVDAFITEIMKDKSINIQAIPDNVEYVIYKSVARLTLNVFYYLLSNMHGFSLLEHQVLLKKERSDKPLVLGNWDKSATHVDDKVLERVADQLLANAAVNSSLVPDAIERPLYINSLRLVFRLLDILAASFDLKVCGHALLLDLMPIKGGNVDGQKHDLSSSLTKIDLDKIRAVARRHAGIVEEDKSELSFLERFSIKEEFLAQLHSSIYALVLGIADDVMANTEMRLLSDKIILDLVPRDPEDKLESESEDKTDIGREPVKAGGSGFDTKSFLVGCGVGLTAAAAVLAAGKK